MTLLQPARNHSQLGLPRFPNPALDHALFLSALRNGTSLADLVAGFSAGLSGLDPDYDPGGATGSKDGTSASAGPVPMTLGIRIVWDFLFLSIILVAIVGNLIVLWIISGERKV